MIQLTESAVNQIKKFRADEKQPDAGLRVAVVGGGCSGMSYKLDFQQEPSQGDKVFEQDGVKVFIDPKSFLYVDGITIDFQDSLMGRGFVFQNPNAKHTCGCGESFSV